MKLRKYADLLILNSVTILLIISNVFLHLTAVRVILALPVILFIPGYAALAALFPLRGQIDGIERVAVSSILSVIIVTLGSLVLNFTPWGISQYSVLTVLTAVTFSTSSVAWLRRSRLDDSAQNGAVVSFSLDFWRNKNIIDKLLLSTLGLAVLATIGILIYGIAVPRTGETFTEFYIATGNEGYLNEISLGQEATVTINITNQEHRAVSYRIEVILSGEKIAEAGPFLLDNGTTTEEEISFLPKTTGDNQKIEFLLFREGDKNAYRSLYLLVDIKE